MTAMNGLELYNDIKNKEIAKAIEELAPLI